MKKKKLAIIGAQGIPSKYGGFETLVEYLVVYLSGKLDITVFCSSKYADTKLKEYKGAQLEYINIDANGWQSILYDSCSILKSYKSNDCLLILGSSGGVILPFLSRYKGKFILNFGGLDWQRNKWNSFTKWFLRFSEKNSVNSCGKLISDNEGIKDYILSKYNLDSTMIAYGGDQVTRSIKRSRSISYKFDNYEYFLTVARIQKDNNIELILNTFTNLQKCKIVIIGNWSKSKYGNNLKKKYSFYNNIYLLDAIYDLDELNYLRSRCKLYIHGHSAGGTNPALVEAMNLGLPIFAFSSGFNEHTTFNRAKYFNSSFELQKLITNIDKHQLVKLGKQMKKIALEHYTWLKISEQYYKIINL